MITWFLIAGSVALVTAGTLFIFWQRRTKWWEFLALLPLPLLACWVAGCVSKNSLIADYEDIGGHLTQVRYYEDWNELQARTRIVGNVPVTHYVTVYHPAEWRAYSSLGQVWDIGQAEYERLASLWGEPSFSDLHRDYDTDDGDMWFVNWNGDDDTMQPCCMRREYDNRTLASPSVFKFTAPEGEWDVYHRNRWEHYDVVTLLGPCSPEERRALQITNAKLSSTRIWVLVYMNQPRAIAAAQEAAWHGGARNDAVLCVGVDEERSLQWAEIFGWSDSEQFMVELRNQALDQEILDVLPIAEWALEHAPQEFIPKDFSEFDYLEIETPFWMLLVGGLIACVLNTAVAVWVVVNEFSD